MSGRENGQSFLCITMEADQFDLIGRQLQINEIFAYRTNLPERLAEKYPSLMDAAQGRFVKKPPFNSVSTFTSMGGENFVSFAKSNKWNKGKMHRLKREKRFFYYTSLCVLFEDLYEDFVAPQLMENLYAETWLNGPDRLPSECHRHMKYVFKICWEFKIPMKALFYCEVICKIKKSSKKGLLFSCFTTQFF